MHNYKRRKMKNFTYLLYFILLVVLPVSCTRNLELEPISTISTASFWKTEDDANGALRGMYIRLRGVTATNLYLWGEARSQNLKQSVGNDFNNLRIYNNTLDPTVAGPDWSSVYRVVNDANLILKYLPGIPFNADANRNRLLAEAFAMRAYCYFVMARTWGALPLVLQPTEGYDPAVLYRERSGINEVFAQIRNDIEQALSLFADNNFQTGRNRWSKPAVNALKGDVFLWTAKKLNGGNNDLNTALAALNEVSKSDVQLLPAFESVFDYTNKGNREILMANNFQQFETGGTFMANMYIDAYPPNADPVAKAIIGTIGGGNYWTLSDDTRSRFSNEDTRKEATYTELYSVDPVSGARTNFYGCIQRKFNGMVDAGARLFIDDVILYRYADVLLLKAEAQNALGQDPADAINEVRKRAYGDRFGAHTFITGSKEANDDAILEERLLELLYEGKYWWDVLRFDKAAALIPYFKANPGHTYKYVWPLSLGILSSEPRVQQNPGY